MAGRSRIETRSRQQGLQHALHAGDRNLRRDEFFHQLLVLRRQIVQQLLGLGIGQKLGHMALEHFGEMGGEHRAGIDHGEAAEAGFLAQRRRHPGGGQAEGRLGGVGAGQVDGQALGIHDQEGAGEQFALAGIDFLDADAVFVGAQLHIVQDAHRRHHKAHFLRQLAAQRLDLVGDAVALNIVDQGQQAIAQFDPQQVERQGGGDRLFLGRAGGFALASCACSAAARASLRLKA